MQRISLEEYRNSNYVNLIIEKFEIKWIATFKTQSNNRRLLNMPCKVYYTLMYIVEGIT